MTAIVVRPIMGMYIFICSFMLLFLNISCQKENSSAGAKKGPTLIMRPLINGSYEK